MAHEIGHWVLHLDLRQHRDRPISGGERANDARPICEQEADCFAGELLMSHKPLTAYFQENFGRPISGNCENLQDLVSWLQSGRQEHVDALQFRQNRRYRSLVTAQAWCCKPGIPFVPLAKRFGVSPTAMAIQLEDCALVV